MANIKATVTLPPEAFAELRSLGQQDIKSDANKVLAPPAGTRLAEIGMAGTYQYVAIERLP